MIEAQDQVIIDHKSSTRAPWGPPLRKGRERKLSVLCHALTVTVLDNSNDDRAGPALVRTGKSLDGHSGPYEERGAAPTAEVSHPGAGGAQGVARLLVEGVLDEARRRGLRAVVTHASCPPRARTLGFVGMRRRGAGSKAFASEPLGQKASRLVDQLDLVDLS